MRTTVLVLLAVLLAGGPLHGQEEPAGGALVLRVEGAIGPALGDFVARGIDRAAAEGRAAVILELDTPGGLDTSMRDIVKAIIAAPLPVITHVSPGGARAASAGTFILYASHVAAMAPATNLGAATPVPIGPGMQPPGRGEERRPAEEPEEADGDAPGEPTSPAGAMERKVLNDAIAYIRGLAKLRGRNADWAERAVREGVSLTAEDALAENVIDLVADDLDDLLRQVDGRTVLVRGEERVLRTAGWSTARLEPDWRTELLAVLTNPNVAYLLMLLGVYGLLFELYSPGAVVPGVVGAIALLVALYAFQVLPVNYAGLALILVGVGLMAAEMVTPSFGIVGGGGVVAFIVGSIILMDTDVEGYEVSMPIIVTLAVTASGLFVAAAVVLLRLRGRPVVTGLEEMTGALGEALESFEDAGQVHVHGEIWSASSRHPVALGQSVRVTRVAGLVLEVEPVEREG